ncbi:Holliday junction resolvase RuvX [Mageeibacillus indolicus]|uniref:Putative pre-16S rRNA nuclease n=1 Tax=Mageeibacillus indolicus TaxID=884684 RepID=A0A2J8B0Y4_9FIRM|nr:Holliday junction resolvase RuvX [Mageeibacillus indolicus]PNH18424.1 Holliday junction resolvase RuvX [Mageeibacillus indolicus]
MEKYLGIDYGQARIGVAVSDALGITARGIETICWNGEEFTKPVNRICELAKQNGVAAIVIGLPRRTDGKIGVSEEKARQLGDLLQELTGLNIIWRDERYTTVLAHRVLNESTVKKRQKRSVVDQVAAEIILQDFLESLRR